MAINVQQLGLQPYQTTWQAMQEFTQLRQEDTPDELWIVEHPATFTQGLNGQDEHLLHQNHEIPIIKTDRGGQITFHAPGQLIIYILFDLKRAKLGVRALVTLIEQSIIDYLQQFNIAATARSDAPGVYVDQQKIASLGLKIRKQKSYHGLALNVDMDLTPFQYINPCGLKTMKMTQLANLLPKPPTLLQTGNGLTQILIKRLTSSHL
ncbi:MAG TPA: lipoyl(octanoyl) transferase LipB [Thiomicrorhabdus sp.]|nr:lipoyl(octanoyl) transferase LipB [Thiomicrorhabdus sp.]